MKKNLFLTLLLFLSLSSVSIAQEQIAITIGDRVIALGEFERLYKKNNASFSMEKQDLDEYLERFINFKLKVIEAENLRNDTTKNFLTEYNSYKKELAKPYMMDSAFVEQMLKNAYNKLQSEVNASHILININENATPSDTLVAWEEITKLRNLALNGEDFGKLASQNSDDPSAIHNLGNLGWFTAFRMVPEFEDKAFNTPVGEISMPVRSKFGYHIIRVNDKRKAMGSVLAAHIYVRIPEDATEEVAKNAEKKIFDIYKSLNDGEDFAKLADLHSDDRASAGNGGKLQWFSSGVMIPEFENAAFSLKNPGDFSAPVKSFFGWHILQLLDKKNIGSYQDERAELLNKINSENYSGAKRKVYIEKLKKEHNFTLNKQNLETFLSYIDTSLFESTWSAAIIPTPDKVLFTVGKEPAKMIDFGRYLEDNPKPAAGSRLHLFVNDQFQKFTEDFVYNYEESMLAEKHPEYKYILQEYHDGILLFDLTDKMVWSKAVNDSSGLEKFFNENRQNYKWGTRAEAYIVTVNNDSLVPNARKFTSRKAGKKDFSERSFANEICPYDSAGTCVEFKYDKFEKGTNALIDSTKWKKGFGDNITENGKVTFVYIRKILKPGYKELDETRGLVISDYQEHLEKLWIKELREKYPVTINRDIISKIN